MRTFPYILGSLNAFGWLPAIVLGIIYCFTDAQTKMLIDENKLQQYELLQKNRNHIIFPAMETQQEMRRKVLENVIRESR